MATEWSGDVIDVRNVTLPNNAFYRRLEKEIDRLKKITERFEGHEKKFVKDLVQTLEHEWKDYSKSANASSSVEVEEKEKAAAAIIDQLNKIEAQVVDLEVSMTRKHEIVSSRAMADRIVSQFFYDCQGAEEKIKHYGNGNYLTKHQVKELNTQLKNLVQRMIALSKTSALLTEAISASHEEKIFS